MPVEHTPVHVLTAGTLATLGALYGEGRFDPRRFGSNLVIATTGATHGFPEDEWVGRTLAVGKEVRLAVTEPCAGA